MTQSVSYPLGMVASASQPPQLISIALGLPSGPVHGACLMTREQHNTINHMRAKGYTVHAHELARSSNVVCLVGRRLGPGKMIVRIYPDGVYIDPLKSDVTPTKLERDLCRITSS